LSTYRQLLKEGEKKLAQAGVPESALDAWYLFSECFQMNRAQFFLKAEEECVHGNCQRHFFQWIERRAVREPLQYILGTQEFMGIRFEVSPSVLIPRQDTEILAEQALLRLKGGERILDMCTGSGCILLSLAKRKKLSGGIGIDISPEALDIAERNRIRVLTGGSQTEVNQICFLHSDLFSGLDKKSNFDMIVSNPPYITKQEMEGLMPEVADYEPHMALFGGEDGLCFYRRIAKEAWKYLCPGGWILLEIGCAQAYAVKVLLQENGYEELEIIQDLAGLDRVVAARRKVEIRKKENRNRENL